MEPIQTNENTIPASGNPLDVSPQVSSAPLPTEAATPPQIHAVVLENASEPEAASTTVVEPFRDVVVPPTPISSEVGTSTTTLDQSNMSQNPPQKSNALGLIIGILLLVSIVVGASLYYYFKIYTKPVAAVLTPPPVTLIKEEPKVTISEPISPPPLPAVDPASLLTEVDAANSNLANIDTTIATFDGQAK